VIPNEVRDLLLSFSLNIVIPSEARNLLLAANHPPRREERRQGGEVEFAHKRFWEGPASAGPLRSR